MMTASAPAFAASTPGPVSTITVTTPGQQVIAAGTTTATAVVRDAKGTPIPGRAVSFTGPSGTSFSPANPTTDGSGTVTTTLTTTNAWATPGSTITVTATSSGRRGTASLTVLGANVGSFLPDTSHSKATITQLPLIFPSPITDIVGGTGFTLALLQDGTVWSSGRNSVGQLGDGTTTDRGWSPISGLPAAKAIAAGDASGYAVLQDGTIRAWGANASGQLGNGTTTNSSTPVAVPGASSARGVLAGHSHAIIFTSAGTQAVGDNSHGQLGDGTTTNRSTPVSIAGLSNVTKVVAGGWTNYALRSGGAGVLAWGKGTSGELGNGSNSDSSTIVNVNSLPGTVSTISAGNGTGYAILTTRALYAWGYNADGELGNGTTTNSNVPVQSTGISSNGANAVTVTGAAAIDLDSNIKAWGNNVTTGKAATGPVAFRSLARGGPCSELLYAFA